MKNKKLSILAVLFLLTLSVSLTANGHASNITGSPSYMPQSNTINPFYMPFLWAPSINKDIPDNGNIKIIISKDNEDGTSEFYHVKGKLQKTLLGHFAVWESDGGLIKSTQPPRPPEIWTAPPEFYPPQPSLFTDTPLNPSEITNLVFSGGGIKGLAYAGALEALEELDILKNITRVAGASAGAITAGLLAVGYDPAEINAELSKTNFADFLDSYGDMVDLPKILQEIKKGEFDPLSNKFTLLQIVISVLSEYGICKGEAFKTWLTDRLKDKGFDENTTFKQLYDSRQIELAIVICNTNYSKTEIADHKKFPDLSIVDAIKSSMSIPFVYSPSTIGGNMYVDGGTMYNYPVDIFDKETGKDATLGFILSSEDSIFNPKRKTINNVFDLILAVFGSIMNVSYEDVFRNDNARRSVFIDCGDIGTLDFDLTDEQKKFLVQQGKDATLQYFKSEQ